MSKGNKAGEVAKIVSVFCVVGKQVSISTDNIEQGNGACSAIQHWSILKSKNRLKCSNPTTRIRSSSSSSVHHENRDHLSPQPAPLLSPRGAAAFLLRCFTSDDDDDDLLFLFQTGAAAFTEF